MRRGLVLCVLFLMTAGAAWAATVVAPRQVTTSPAPRQVREHARAERSGASRRGSVLFGDQAVEPGAGRDASGSVKAFRFADKRTGTALSITVYVGSRSTARTLVVGIFASQSRRSRAAARVRFAVSTQAGGVEHGHHQVGGRQGGARLLGGCAREGRHVVLPRAPKRVLQQRELLEGPFHRVAILSASVVAEGPAFAYLPDLGVRQRQAFDFRPYRPPVDGSPNTVTSPSPSPPVNTILPVIAFAHPATR